MKFANGITSSANVPHLNVWGFDISAAEFPQPKKTRVFGVNRPLLIIVYHEHPSTQHEYQCHCASFALVIPNPNDYVDTITHLDFSCRDLCSRSSCVCWYDLCSGSNGVSCGDLCGKSSRVCWYAWLIPGFDLCRLPAAKRRTKAASVLGARRHVDEHVGAAIENGQRRDQRLDDGEHLGRHGHEPWDGERHITDQEQDDEPDQASSTPWDRSWPPPTSACSCPSSASRSSASRCS